MEVEIVLATADSVITFELGLGLAPEVFNTIDVLTLACSVCLSMVNDFRFDDLAQGLSRYVTDYASVNTAIAPKQAKNGYFAGCPAPAKPFALAPEVAFIALDLTTEQALRE